MNQIYTTSRISPRAVVLLAGAVIAIGILLWLIKPGSEPAGPPTANGEDSPAMTTSTMKGWNGGTGTRTRPGAYLGAMRSPERPLGTTDGPMTDPQERAYASANRARELLQKPEAGTEDIPALPATPGDPSEVSSPLSNAQAATNRVYSRRESDRIRRALVGEMRMVRRAAMLEGNRGQTTNP